MLKKEIDPETQEVSKDVLSRRTALKRIAAGLATAGVVVVAGIVIPDRPSHAAEYGDSAPKNSKPVRSDSIDAEYGDSAPKHRKPGRDSCDAEYGDAKS